jgi:hypothetical protein
MGIYKAYTYMAGENGDYEPILSKMVLKAALGQR